MKLVVCYFSLSKKKVTYNLVDTELSRSAKLFTRNSNSKLVSCHTLKFQSSEVDACLRFEGGFLLEVDIYKRDDQVMETYGKKILDTS